jgi:hypothetical protein
LVIGPSNVRTQPGRGQDHRKFFHEPARAWSSLIPGQYRCKRIKSREWNAGLVYPLKYIRKKGEKDLIPAEGEKLISIVKNPGNFSGK